MTGRRRFAGSVSGFNDKSTASRFNSTAVSSHVRGWDIGVETTAYVDSEGRDAFRISLTRGSNRSNPIDTVAYAWLDEDGKIQWTATREFEYRG